MGMVNRSMQTWSCWQKGGIWPTVIYKVLSCLLKNQHLRIPRQPLDHTRPPSCLLALGRLVETWLEAAKRGLLLMQGGGAPALFLALVPLTTLPFNAPDVDLASQYCCFWTYMGFRCVDTWPNRYKSAHPFYLLGNSLHQSSSDMLNTLSQNPCVNKSCRGQPGLGSRRRVSCSGTWVLFSALIQL